MEEGQIKGYRKSMEMGKRKYRFPSLGLINTEILRVGGCKERCPNPGAIVGVRDNHTFGYLFAQHLCQRALQTPAEDAVVLVEAPIHGNHRPLLACNSVPALLL